MPLTFSPTANGIRLTVQLICALITFFSDAAAITATAATAPPLLIPPIPPARQGCAGAWQVARRVGGFDGGAGYLIEADYDSAQGIGRLQRRGLSGVGAGGNPDGAGATVGALVWDAGELLDRGAWVGGPEPAARRIFTMSAAGAALPFEWNRLDGAQRAALDPDGAGEARVAYLRGDRAREGELFRKRTSLLGAIVHGAPLVAGTPVAGAAAAASPGYAEFFQRYRNRQKMLYVGGNDGMLHGFDWSDGTERFAYIPAALLPSLYRLGAGAAVPPAGAGADAGGGIGIGVGVEATPGIGEALTGGRWRSVLASGMGMSARGLFALDITDPSQDPLVLWEFGERDDAAAGFIHAAPTIIKLRSDGGRGGLGGAASYRYFALVANGFNAADGSADGVLFLLALDKPAGAPWRQGENYYKLRAAAREPQGANALAPPVVTTDADGTAHNAYAGDLQGTMWRFDLAAPASGAAASELFRARAADGTPQPIADAAQVVFAPGGGFLVLFGTGRSIETGDLQPASFVQQSMYAVRDTDSRPLAPVSGRAALAARSARGFDTADGFSIAGDRFDYNGRGAGVKQGWYLDFPRSLQDGERNAAAPALAGAAVVFTGSAPGADHCAPAVRSYAVDSLTGMAYDRRGKPAPGVLDGDPGTAVTGRRFISSDGVLPMLVSLVVNSEPGATPTGARGGLRRLALYQLPPNGAAPAPALDRVLVTAVAGRLSWREIVNWRELHHAAAAAGAAPATSPP